MATVQAFKATKATKDAKAAAAATILAAARPRRRSRTDSTSHGSGGTATTSTPGSRFTSASSWFPSIFASQFINFVKHFFFGEPDNLFIAIFVAPLSCGFEKVANEDFGTEAEMLPLEVLDAFLLEVLKIEPTEKFIIETEIDNALLLKY